MMDRDDDRVDGQNLANQFIWVNIGTSRLKRSKKGSVCSAYKYYAYIYIYLYIFHLVVIQLVVYVDGLPFLESLMTSGRKNWGSASNCSFFVQQPHHWGIPLPKEPEVGW